MPRSTVWCVSALRSMRSDRVLFLEAVQRVGELVLVALDLAWIATASTGSGGSDRLDLDRRALRGEHVAGAGVGELRDRGDVARRDLGDGVLLLAAHREELVQALVGLGAAVGELVVVLDPCPGAP